MSKPRKSGEMKEDRLRVLVVDDSILMRNILTDILSRSGIFEVVATARDGAEAIELAADIEPDVITMDLDMPSVDGIEAIKRIMSRRPTPIVVISGAENRGYYNAITALEVGAVDFIPKPSGEISPDLDDISDLIISKVEAAARANLRRVKRRTVRKRKKASAAPMDDDIKEIPNVIVIGSSTGGPNILPSIFSGFKEELRACVLLAQHMPPGFTSSLATRLNSVSPLTVMEAKNESVILPRLGYVAPGGYNISTTYRPIKATARHRMKDDPYFNIIEMMYGGLKAWYFVELSRPKMEISGFRALKPSVDKLMLSAAKVFGDRCIGVILSGMGYDGSIGMAAIKKAGGITIAQDPDTAIISSMPEHAISRGVVDHILPPEEIAAKINNLL